MITRFNIEQWESFLMEKEGMESNLKQRAQYRVSGVAISKQRWGDILSDFGPFYTLNILLHYNTQIKIYALIFSVI